MTNESLKSAHDAPIAIVGAACRLPGDVEHPTAFWRMLTDGRDGVGPIPAARRYLTRFLDAEPALKGRSRDVEAGFIEDLGCFDPAFFDIPIEEASVMDPQHLLALETAWLALHGKAEPAVGDEEEPVETVRPRIGLYLGLGPAWTPALDARHVNDPLYRVKGVGFAAGRLAQQLGIEGPVVPLAGDAACALSGLHLAVAALQRGDCEQALVGAAQALFDPSAFTDYARAGLLSARGRCKAFQQDADGLVRAEGCVMLLLKPLETAMRDGDDIWCLIGGSAIGHTGSSASLSVPQGAAQRRVIEEAQAIAGVDASQIAFVEADGSGTTMGDFVEFNSLAKVYGASRVWEKPLLVGSAKTNVGHLGAAAGAVSILKAALAIRHRQIPPNLFTDNPSGRIAWETAPLTLVDELTGWFDGERAFAGVSAFGLDGVQAHVILAEPEDQADRGELREPVIPFERIPLIPEDPLAQGPQGKQAGLLQAPERRRPMLGRRLLSPLPQTVFAGEVHRSGHSLCFGTRWGEDLLFPTGVILELGLEVALQAPGGAVPVLRDIRFSRSMPLDRYRVYDLQSIGTPSGTGESKAGLYIRDRSAPGASWNLLASLGHSTGEEYGEAMKAVDPSGFPGAGEPLDRAAFYALLERGGYGYDASFQVFDEVRITDARITGWMAPKASTPGDFVIHPRFLESGMQLLLAALQERSAPDVEPLFHYPRRIGKLEYLEPTLGGIWAEALITRRSSEELQASLRFYDEEGGALARLEECVIGRSEAPLPADLLGDQGLWSALASLRPDQRVPVMQQFIRRVAVDVLELPPDTPIIEDKSFREYGFDSLSTSQFLERLNADLGIELTQSFYLDFPNLSTLSDYLLNHEDIVARIERSSAAVGTAATVGEEASWWAVQTEHSAVEQMNAMERIILQQGKGEDEPKPARRPRGFWTRLFDRMGRAKD